jgi:hypothetical protein
MVNRGKFGSCARWITFAVPTITGILKRHFRGRGCSTAATANSGTRIDLWRWWPTLVQEVGSVLGVQDLATEQVCRSAPCSRLASQARAIPPPRSMQRCRMGSGSAPARQDETPARQDETPEDIRAVVQRSPTSCHPFVVKPPLALHCRERIDPVNPTAVTLTSS